MTRMTLTKAVDRALANAMAKDDRIVVFGEDVSMLHPALSAASARIAYSVRRSANRRSSAPPSARPWPA